MSTIIAGIPAGKALTVESGSAFYVAIWFNAAANKNSVVADAASLSLAGSFIQTGNPTFTIVTTNVEPTFTGLDSFFEQTNYVGAFGSIDWSSWLGKL